ncbi:unnamed protein product [Arctogadus glacialis]
MLQRTHRVTAGRALSSPAPLITGPTLHCVKHRVNHVKLLPPLYHKLHMAVEALTSETHLYNSTGLNKKRSAALISFSTWRAAWKPINKGCHTMDYCFCICFTHSLLKVAAVPPGVGQSAAGCPSVPEAIRLLHNNPSNFSPRPLHVTTHIGTCG